MIVSRPPWFPHGCPEAARRISDCIAPPLVPPRVPGGCLFVFDLFLLFLKKLSGVFSCFFVCCLLPFCFFVFLFVCLFLPCFLCDFCFWAFFVSWLFILYLKNVLFVLVFLWFCFIFVCFSLFVLFVLLFVFLFCLFLCVVFVVFLLISLLFDLFCVFVSLKLP